MNTYTIKYENDEAFNNILYRNGWMHWLPMTPDAVFEDEVRYIIRKANGYVESVIYNAFEKEFYSAGFDDWITRESITHYARITEPNK